MKKILLVLCSIVAAGTFSFLEAQTQEEMKKAQKNYIDKLYEFNALRTNTQELSEGNPYFNMDSILHIHESSPIYGDLDALNSGQSIPNLKYSDRAGSMDIDFSKLG